MDRMRLNSKFEEYLMLIGIRHQLTAPYAPEQNGISERANRNLMEKVWHATVNAGTNAQNILVRGSEHCNLFD